MSGQAYPTTWRRPPQIVKNRRWRIALQIGIAVYLVLAIGTLEIDWQRVAIGLERGQRFVMGFLQPDFTSRWDDIVRGLVESLTMTLTSTVVGVAISVPIGIGAARNLAPRAVYLVCRSIIAVSRSLQEVIIAIFLVAMLGFGPFAGFVTLAFATIGFLAKLLADDIEEIDEAQAEAIRATGASWLQLVNYAVQPQVMPRLIGLSLYRLDINFRESAVIGIVGAGGIGATLNTAIDRYEHDSADPADHHRHRLGGGIRLQLPAEVPAMTQASFDRAAWRHRTPRARLAAWFGCLALVALFVWCWQLMTENTIWAFVRDAPRQASDIGSRMVPPAWGYLPELMAPLWDTINIATLGTIGGVIMAVPVAFLAARNTTPSAAILRPIALFIIVASRSINALIWALLLVAIIGPGLLAGIIAIALRSIGFVGKLLYEAIEETDARQVEAIEATGASGVQVLSYGIVPQVMPAFWGISVFRWDINIRESTILGLVGAGGIGMKLQASLNVVAWGQVTVILLLILATVVLSEWVSARVRHAII